MREKERGRRKMTERARKCREWALIMRFDSKRIPHRFRFVAAAAITALLLCNVNWVR